MPGSWASFELAGRGRGPDDGQLLPALQQSDGVMGGLLDDTADPQHNTDFSRSKAGIVSFVSNNGRTPCRWPDIRLIEAKNFETDEALLTGESLPVRKAENSVFDAATGPGDRLNVAYKTMNLAGLEPPKSPVWKCVLLASVMALSLDPLKKLHQISPSHEPFDTNTDNTAAYAAEAAIIS